MTTKYIGLVSMNLAGQANRITAQSWDEEVKPSVIWSGYCNQYQRILTEFQSI